MKEKIKDHWLELASFIASVGAGFWAFAFADLGGAWEDHPTAVLLVAVASLLAGSLLGNALPCFKRYRKMQALKRAFNLITRRQADFVRLVWDNREVLVADGNRELIDELQTLGIIDWPIFPDRMGRVHVTLRREVLELFARDGVEKYLTQA